MLAAAARRVTAFRVLCVLLVAALAATVTTFIPATRDAAWAAPVEDPAPPAVGPAERPDFISAQVAAHVEKRRIEVTSERS